MNIFFSKIGFTLLVTLIKVARGENVDNSVHFACQIVRKLESEKGIKFYGS